MADWVVGEWTLDSMALPAAKAAIVNAEGYFDAFHQQS
jgi:hypothetical protein